MGAAMMGGVEGHAGLFSDAYDMAALMQMLLDGGRYGGVQYLDPKTIRLFTAKQTGNSRRGLGFDKPETDARLISPTSELVSSSAFGHSGFTGTCVWADPAYDLVYVFLSNRIHPDMDNRKLISENVRTKIQDVIYSDLIQPDDRAMNEEIPVLSAPR
jgi:CubicO group peptidase (beta-lactamase class C family)